MTDKRPLTITAVMSLISMASAAFGAIAGIWVYKHSPIRSVDEISTHRLVVVDSTGQSRAILGANSRGEVSMEFMSLKQQPSLSLGVSRQGDQEGPTQQIKNSERIGVPYIRLFGEPRSPAMEMTVNANNNPTMGFHGVEPTGGLNLGYLSDLSDYGPQKGGWGLRAYYRDVVKDVGVAAYDTDNPYSIVPPPPHMSNKAKK